MIIGQESSLGYKSIKVCSRPALKGRLLIEIKLAMNIIFTCCVCGAINGFLRVTEIKYVK